MCLSLGKDTNINLTLNLRSASGPPKSTVSLPGLPVYMEVHVATDRRVTISQEKDFNLQHFYWVREGRYVARIVQEVSKDWGF